MSEKKTIIAEEIISIVIFIIGILFMSIPTVIESILPFIMLGVLAIYLIISLILYLKDKKEFVEVAIAAFLLAALVILVVVFTDYALLVALTMAAYCLLKAIKWYLSLGLRLSHFTQ